MEIPYIWGFPGGSGCKESACNAGELGSIPELGRCPGGGWQPTPVFLPGEFQGQRSLAGSMESQGVRHERATDSTTQTLYIN